MSYLPRITCLDVSGYELYPGTPVEPGLHREIWPGLTLVIGANGLGKTTLVTLLRHMCAGPQRLSNRVGGTFEAGRLRTTAVDVETFADRVGDRAADASARLSMSVGATLIETTRSLRNLSLTQLVVDGSALDANEDSFRSAVVMAAQVTDYADWLLLVDHLVFVTEDRLLPFWDRHVQRQLLRVLTRDAAAARALSDAESHHISTDSDFRNARVQLSRQKQRLAALAAQVAGSGNITDTIAKLTVEKDSLDREVADREVELDHASERFHEALRAQEVAELEHQLSTDELEVARFELIESVMPTQGDVVRYLRSRLATDRACPICGQEGGDIDAQLNAAICLLCGLPTADDDLPGVRATLSELETRVSQAAKALAANRSRADERATMLRTLETELAALRSRRFDLDGRLKALRSKLPRGAGDLSSTSAAVSELEHYVDSLRAELQASRTRLQGLIDQGNKAVAARQGAIKRVFDDVATTFLVEPCHLVPHQTFVRIGQEGARFEVQGFDLDLGSSTELGESRRESSDHVSESQRVFIDIAFRIALVHTCVGDRVGTMVIDAPEGSLDAVFTSNAARLLGKFVNAEVAGNRLVVASNLVEGSLLPALAEVARIDDASDRRLINLLEIAAPTSAVTQHGDEYRTVLARALSGRRQGPEQ